MKEWAAMCRSSAGFCSSFAQTSKIHLCHVKHARNHYEVLGISHSATLREIKEAYYTKSKICHPDSSSNGNPTKTTAEFVELKKAYGREFRTTCSNYRLFADILRRPADRRQYDLFLSGVHQYTYRRPHRQPPQSPGSTWSSYYEKESGDAFAKRRERERQSWRNVIWVAIGGFTLVSIYNFFYWYEIYKKEKAYDRLIAKDEIARSFLRQREFKDQRNDQVQLDLFARILREDIEEARKRRDEEHRTSGIKNPLEIREEERWMAAVRVLDPRKQ